MNEMTIFNNPEFGEIRTVIKDDEPMFCLMDICKALEIKNATDVAKRLEEDEVTRLNLGGRVGETNFITESGLYAVILRSDKPNAKRFRKWVTSEVLPSIRKTGSYSTTGVATPNMVLALEDRIKDVEANLVEKFYEMDLMLKATNSNASPITYEECLPCFIAPETYIDTRTKCVNLATQIATLWGAIDTQETPYQKIYNLILKKHNINVWSCTTHYNQIHNTTCSPFTVILNSKVLTQLFISTAEEIIDSLQTHKELESITSFSDALTNLGQLAVKDYNSNILNLYKTVYKMMDVDWSSYPNTPKLTLIRTYPELQSVFVECVNRLIN